jgi:ligand-binding SRPBCC domain-containing protein
MASIQLRTEIAAPVEVVFDLARSIDAHLDSMARSRERAVGGVTSGLIGLGEQVTWKATHFFVPFTMTSKVTEMTPPHRFVDEQVRGPFARFHHEHRFESSDGGTVMLDAIEFASPLGPIGRLVDRLGLQRYLTKLIQERNTYLKARAEVPQGPV